MSWRFNPPPGWPPVPPGWVPPPGWRQDASWPAAPPDWTFWVEEAAPPTESAPAGAQPRRRSGGRWLIAVLVVVVLLGMSAIAVAVIGAVTRQSANRELVTQTPAAAVRVDNQCGPIELRQGPPGQVSTGASLRYSRTEPEVTSRLEGGVVEVRVDCAPFSVFNFGTTASLVVEVPPDGAVEARSSAGSVAAERLSSDLTLHSSAGSVSAVDVTSDIVVADSSAGSVSLTWSGDADPRQINAQSSAGSVRVTIPDVAGVSYRVDADSSAGSVSVDVRTDPRSERTIRATSSAGSVRVEYR